MGIVINSRDVNARQVGLLETVIFCQPPAGVLDKAISLNKVLAERLIKIEPKRRSIRINSCLQETIDSLPNDAIVKDFDVLFNPIYEIDVLKSMIAVCKAKPFQIIWPGRFEDEKLIYGEEGYLDYKVFNIADYDITIVK